MPSRPLSSDSAPKAIGPYSQAILVERGGARTLYLSGQIPLDPATGELVQGDVAAQTERVLSNAEALLTAAGLGFADVVKTTVFLADLGDFAKMNEVYARRFQAPYPARSTIQVAGLPRGAGVEIEIVAVGD
jgi:2-iminobutanoate/2-iminopropanoate deaminase